MKCVDYKSVELESFDVEGARGAGIRWLIGKADGAGNFAMRMIEIEPGGCSPYHSHGEEHEAFILRGRGEMRSKSERYQLAPGTVVFVPCEEEHQFVNLSDEEKLEFICVIPL
ncbi:MAG: cupin domain-containing protein [Gemmatimonadota bacterium]|nr:cupin domain-containing protein [Gemmatimonadota bacterium]